MASIENLPDEVLLRIFRNLALKEILLLQFVNHRWRQIATDRTFFSTVSLTENDSNSFITVLLNQHKNVIRNLSIVEHNDIDLLAPLISECNNLEALSIKLCNGNGNQLLRSIERCTRLNVIILQHTPVQRLDELLEILSHRPMKKINIRNMDADIRAEDLSNLRAVEDLRLKSIRVHPNAIYRFCSYNARFLTTLKLIVSDESWLLSCNLNETVFKAIGNCIQLKSLCLGPQITSTLNDIGFAQITRLNCLCSFEIHNAISVSSSAFKAFFGRPSSVNLRKISLYKCPSINTTVLQEIAGNCNKLEKFTLEKSKACKCNRDLEDIVTFAQNCKRIRRLHLFGMHIIVAEALYLMPKYLPELESLKYSNSDKPMKIPAFLSLLQDHMHDFEICGMQWTYNLYVHCKRKRLGKPSVTDNLVCGNSLKMKPVYY